MRVVAQRVGEASVRVAGETVASAERLYLFLVSELARELGKQVPTGVFGADMEVALRNQGPVTLLMDSKRRE